MTQVITVVSNKRDTIRSCDVSDCDGGCEMHFCGETNTESERVMTGPLILNCPMIIFTDSFCRYHLFNNYTSSAEFCRHNFFQFEHIPSHWVFTSTEADPDRTFRLKAADILSPGPEEAWHGAVAGAELDPWQSTVVCLGSRSLVSFSPMLAWRNQGREILRRVLPDFGGLLGLVIVAIMSTIFFITGYLYHCSCWATLTITSLLSSTWLSSAEHFTLLPSNIKSYFPCNCCINRNVLPSRSHKTIRGGRIINIPDRPQ